MACAYATAYRFLDLADPAGLAAELEAVCARERLLGTVTLAAEGLNLALAGDADALDRLEHHLRRETPFAGLRLRRSAADAPPFRRLQVQLRPSLLALRLEAPVAARRPGRQLPPERLRAWLDEGRPLRLLDARNRFESRLGRFAAAETLPLARFRDFPTAAGQLAADERPLVTYCTGGIRCEVASAWLGERGHADVWQLSGGVLHYFERCGGRHWTGDCFVFDDRLAIDPELRATRPRLCPRCQRRLDRGRCPDCGAPPLGTD